MLTRRAVALAAAALPVAAALPLPLRAGDTPLKLREFYARGGGLSEFAHTMAGQRLSVYGFMAPPLKADARFFVLTKMPMSYCPFCESAAEWPDDILAVYTKRVIEPVAFNVGIETRGVLEIGEYSDPDTGFVSLIRLMDASYA